MSTDPLPEGVIVVGLDDPAELHNTLADIFGEPKLMTRKTNAQIAAEARKDASLRAARDLGREAHKHEAELALITVGRAGAALFPDDKECQIAYLQGYIEARTQHEAFKRGE